jgi:hypothetical protein
MTKEEFISLYKDSHTPEFISRIADYIFAPENRVHQKWLIDGFDVVNGEMVRKPLQNA